jgi:heat shock protein HslJ
LSADDLAGTSWQLVKFQGGDGSSQLPDDRTKYTMVFGSDGKVAFRLDCNRANGTYTSAGPGQIQFGPMAATMAACPPGSMADKISRDLGNVRSYTLKDGHLFLALMADAGSYEYEPINSLTGSSWLMVKFQGGNGTIVRPKDPANYTLAFGKDGRTSLKIDCNTGGGPWTVRGPGAVQFGPVGMTRMACTPPDPLATKYATDFTNIKSFVIKDGNLFLSLAADAGTYEFSPADPLTGTAWGLIQFKGSDGTVMRPTGESKYTAAFAREGVVTAQIDCNRGSGSWSSSGPGQIQFGPMAMTMMACPPSQLGNKYPRDWGLIRSYAIRNGHLFLSLPGDGGSYEYEPLKTAVSGSGTTADPITGTAWSLIMFQGRDGTTLRPTGGSKYTAAFARGGVVAVQIDCNKGNGSWSSSGLGQIQFGPVALTRMACPPSQLTDRYGRDWGLIRSYLIKNGHLFLLLPENAGAYEYEPLKSAQSAPNSVGNKTAAGK